jgi:hypothetical protein
MKERKYVECAVCKNIIEEEKAEICEECLEYVCNDCLILTKTYRNGIEYSIIVCFDCYDYVYAEYEEKMLELKKQQENEK